MALKSETASPPNGVANIISQESGAPINEDLEDGEIFDDDEDEAIPPPKASTPPAADPSPTTTSPVPSKKRPLSPADNDRRRPPRQRRSKRAREDDRPFPRKQRRRSEEHEKNREKELVIDEDELLNVTRIRSPPPGARSNNNDWDRYNLRSDDEDEEGGNGGNRRNRRDGFRRRMRPRGGGRRGNRRDHNICKFFLQGKCQRGSECPYPHGSPSHRKYELCKFYMNDCCAKKDKCLFMHNDFPCKFFHLGLKCYAGKRCKFSHTKVSPYVKQQLIKHNQSESDKHFLHNLETASPRESPCRDHFGGDSPPPVHHHRREGHHHSRHQSSNRHHNHQEMRRSVSPPPSEHNEDRRYNEDYDQGLQTQPNDSYSDDERNRTPMPSPSQDNSSDRDMRSPEQELICDYSSNNSDTPASDQKDSGIGEEMPQEVPVNLPPKQRELYLRIQQQQRHAQESQNAEGDELMKEEEFKEEEWYSSDEEGGTAPLTTILKTIKPDSKPGTHHSVPEVLPDFDVSAVSKLLTTVRETIQQQQQQQNSPQHQGKSNLQQSQKSSQEVKRRVRDPRLRAVGSPPLERRSPNDFVATSLPPLPAPGDVDLRLASTTPSSTAVSSTTSLSSLPTDVDLRQLPFKPAPIHQAANEIDASITSHPILNYCLIPFPPVPKPDYSHVQPKSVTDPRLRKYIGQPLQAMSLPLPAMVGNTNAAGHAPPPVATSPRDPRQRVNMLPNDPRRRPAIQQPSGPPAGVHGVHLRDSDLRGHPSPYPAIGNDIDLRYQQPAPNFSYD